MIKWGVYGQSVSGKKVTFNNECFKNRYGFIRDYIWNTGDFIIEMDNGKYLPFKANELEEAKA